MDSLVMYAIYAIGFMFGYGLGMGATDCELVGVLAGIITGGIFTFFVLDLGGGDENKY